MGALAVAGIDIYRRYISPWKGFRCAHHVLHGEGSCSDYGRQVFAAYRFGEALRLMRARFEACKAAAQVVAAGAAVGARPLAMAESRGEDDGRQAGPVRRWWRRQSDRCNRYCHCDVPTTSCPSFDCSPPAGAVDLCSVGDACACSW